jgi:hypothetical protein
VGGNKNVKTAQNIMISNADTAKQTSDLMLEVDRLLEGSLETVKASFFWPARPMPFPGPIPVPVVP